MDKSQYEAQPIIVSIENTSDEWRAHINVLDNTVKDVNVTIAHVDNPTVKDLLTELGRDFIVGVTYLLCKDVDQIINSTFQIVDEEGNAMHYIPTIDPHQETDDIITIEIAFMLNKDRKMILQNLRPKTTVEFRMYPQAKEKLKEVVA